MIEGSKIITTNGFYWWQRTKEAGVSIIYFNNNNNTIIMTGDESEYTFDSVLAMWPDSVFQSIQPPIDNAPLDQEPTTTTVVEATV